MSESPMSQKFHDWLEQCPVKWFVDKTSLTYIYYGFETPVEETTRKLVDKKWKKVFDR